MSKDKKDSFDSPILRKNNTVTRTDSDIVELLENLTGLYRDNRVNNILIKYKPAAIYEGKEIFVAYWVLDPSTDKLKRIKKKFNYIKDKRERDRQMKKYVREINELLHMGYNPLLSPHTKKIADTISEAVKNYLKHKAKEGKRPDTLRTYNSICNVFLSWIGDGGYLGLSPNKFTKSMAQTYMDHLLTVRNMGQRSYNNYLNNSKILFKWFITHGYCIHNPFDGIPKLNTTEKSRKPFTLEQRKTINEYLKSKDVDFKLPILLAYATLIRSTEITKLKISDLKMDKGIIALPGSITKNKKHRNSTIPQYFLEYLQALDLQNYSPNAYLCSKNFTPGPIQITARTIREKWLLIRKELNLPEDCKFYSLRDTGITQLIEDGIPLNKVKDQAGHHDLSITSIYVRQTNTNADPAINKKASKF